MITLADFQPFRASHDHAVKHSPLSRRCDDAEPRTCLHSIVVNIYIRISNRPSRVLSGFFLVLPFLVSDLPVSPPAVTTSQQLHDMKHLRTRRPCPLEKLVMVKPPCVPLICKSFRSARFTPYNLGNLCFGRPWSTTSTMLRVGSSARVVKTNSVLPLTPTKNTTSNRAFANILSVSGWWPTDTAAERQQLACTRRRSGLDDMSCFEDLQMFRA